MELRHHPLRAALRPLAVRGCRPPRNRPAQRGLDPLAIIPHSDRLLNAEAADSYCELVAKTRRLNSSQEKMKLESAVYQLIKTIRRQEETTGVVEESCIRHIQEHQAACQILLERQAAEHGEQAEQHVANVRCAL